MKKHFLIIAIAFVQTITFGQTAQEKNPQAAFYSAFAEIKNMLEGKDSLNYEKAVFITENAYYDNAYNLNDFKQAISIHTGLINSIAENARKENKEKYKTLKLYEQKMFDLNTLNWAIFKYITDTTYYYAGDTLLYKAPYSYSTEDPYGSTKWENTQVLHLLANDNEKGNCYALSTLFKIFSDRLKTEARLTIAPHHIYIENRNQKGDFKNVELATKTFPGDGSIQTLTYTTHELIMNGMSQRMLSDKDGVALNLIYLAKGFEHKFNDNTNDFLLKCADLAFKHDSLSLNALLLKAEVTENRLFAAMQKNKITTVSQARTNPQTQKLLASYEKQLSNFYKIGYREIPKDIEHMLLSAMQGNKDGYITTDKTPNPFAPIGQKQRYATLSWGLFDEMHADVDTIQYFHASLNTKKKKIIEFFPIDTTNNYKVDPVVFAMSVDPMQKKYPGISPYVFVADNPIMYIDPDGAVITIPNKDDRAPLLKMINSRAAGVFGVNAKGELYVIKKEGSKGYSEYYRDKLIAAIGSGQTIDLNIKNEIDKQPTLSKDGKSVIKDSGEPYNVDNDAGAGVTFGLKGTNQIVYISGNENKDLKDTEGKELRDKPADVLAHELVGHAIPKIVGTDTGNAVKNENKVREQLKPGENQKREAEPAHAE